MISIGGAVTIIFTLIIAALIFGLLWFALSFVGSKIPGAPGQWFITVGQIILVLLAVLVLVGILLSMVNNQPLFRP